MTDPETPTYRYVDGDDALAALVRDLNEGPAATGDVAIDTEADSLHSYRQKVCLIQMSANGSGWLVDPLAEIDLAPLLDHLAHRTLILHGADYDLRMLRECYEFHPHGDVIDTMLAAKILGYDRVGLAALIEEFLGISLSKRGQRSDWSRRPLTDAQIEYAASDTLYLHEMWAILRERLEDRGRLEWHRQACERLVEATGRDSDNGRDPVDRWRLKGASRLEPSRLRFVRSLWEWRDHEAERADRPPFKILGNQQLIDLAGWAESHPGDPVEDGPRLPRDCVGRRRKALVAAIRAASVLPEDEWPEQRRHRYTGPAGPDIRPQVEALRRESAAIARDLEMDPAVLAPRAALAAIARANAIDSASILEATQLLPWQAELLVPVARRVLEPDGDGEDK